MLNPAASGARASKLYRMLGGLLGLCLRSKHPLPFELPAYAEIRVSIASRRGPLMISARSTYDLGEAHL
jgi:hypothetical protein